jgi:hypothetical protein
MRDEARVCDIVNANYQKVLFVLYRNLQDDRSGLCRCEKCVSDMTSFALNCLPPHYYVDAKRGGSIGSPIKMVECAVREAMEMVGKNPRHEECGSRRMEERDSSMDKRNGGLNG